MGEQDGEATIERSEFRLLSEQHRPLLSSIFGLKKQEKAVFSLSPPSPRPDIAIQGYWAEVKTSPV